MKLKSLLSEGVSFKDLKRLRTDKDIDASYRSLDSLEGAPMMATFAFNCAKNNLSTLVGGPEFVGGDFVCLGNHLTDLKGAPKVAGSFICGSNKITSLVGAPKTGPESKNITSFHCNNNMLTNLRGSPSEVMQFDCDENRLTSLEGGPTHVSQGFSCYKNVLTSVEGAPKWIGNVGNFNNNLISSLKDIHKHIEHAGDTLFFQDNPIKSHVLGLLKIKGLKKVYLSHLPGRTHTSDNLSNAQLKLFKVQNTINDHLDGARDIFACQEELEDEGLEEYAQL